MIHKAPTCPYCGSPAKLVDSATVYHGRSYGMIWDCRPCDAYVGTHKDSDRHAPLGRLANAELRKAKMDAHATFDSKWRTAETLAARRVLRTSAYAWLAERMGLPIEKTHIGYFDLEQCKRVVELCVEEE